ncbi:unnamed protein product [Dovyalis caffra]|uniref:Maturase K n=1 Tax=Dovyalis caffra TaxID=77055 RepID=A0AAV1SB76_9ROSI|nr:unnamed protein product [Dovyalis caffra]
MVGFWGRTCDIFILPREAHAISVLVGQLLFDVAALQQATGVDAIPRGTSRNIINGGSFTWRAPFLLYCWLIDELGKVYEGSHKNNTSGRTTPGLKGRCLSRLEAIPFLSPSAAFLGKIAKKRRMQAHERPMLKVPLKRAPNGWRPSHDSHPHNIRKHQVRIKFKHYCSSINIELLPLPPPAWQSFLLSPLLLINQRYLFLSHLMQTSRLITQSYSSFCSLPFPIPKFYSKLVNLSFIWRERDLRDEYITFFKRLSLIHLRVLSIPSYKFTNQHGHRSIMDSNGVQRWLQTVAPQRFKKHGALRLTFTKARLDNKLTGLGRLATYAFYSLARSSTGTNPGPIEASPTDNPVRGNNGSGRNETIQIWRESREI